MLKETTGALNGACTQDWLVTCQTRFQLCHATSLWMSCEKQTGYMTDAVPTVPCHPSMNVMWKTDWLRVRRDSICHANPLWMSCGKTNATLQITQSPEKLIWGKEENLTSHSVCYTKRYLFTWIKYKYISCIIHIFLHKRQKCIIKRLHKYALYNKA